ncbi:MAG: DUF6616 family protein [Halioglobus sp.]
MYLYVETWSPKPEWLALSAEERVEFIERIQILLGDLASDNLQLLGCAISDDDMHLHGGYQYVAVWRASDRQQVARIEEGTERNGWHNYFEQVNHGSSEVGPEAVLGHMLNI